MSASRDGTLATCAVASQHLNEAHHHLVIAILHLAAIEDDLKISDFMKSRMLISESLSEIVNAQEILKV